MKTEQTRLYPTILHICMIIVAAACILPFLLLIVSSFTNETEIIKNGYSFFPKQFSLDAYIYLFRQLSMLVRAYGITVLITAIGTSACLVMTSMLAYPLSRRDVPFRNSLSFFVFFTLLFSGGLVPTYLIYTQWFGIKNTIWALIVPGLLMNGFNVLLMRTFFITNIPSVLIEAAQIDGAGEFRTYYRIILPLSLPILATIGLLAGIGYWNDWFNGLTYLTDPKLFSIQNILNRILMDIQFLTSNPGAQVSGAVSRIPGASVRMAIAVIGILPIVAAYPFFQKFYVKGIAIGAVKE